MSIPICAAREVRKDSLLAAKDAAVASSSSVNASDTTQSQLEPEESSRPTGHSGHVDVVMISVATAGARLGTVAASVSATYTAYRVPGNKSPVTLNVVAGADDGGETDP